MICCTNCFIDITVKSVITSLKTKGNCDICGSHNVFIYDTAIDRILIESFNGLLDIYKTRDNLPTDFPKVNLNLLKDELYSNWDIFSIQKDQIYFLIKEICKEKYNEDPDIFDSPIGILETVQEQYLTQNSLLKTYDWEEFVISIKTQNRFHTDYINKEVLNLFCDYTRIFYKKGDVFHRARMSEENGFEPVDMMAPPSEKASAGRINSMGISCLYLSNNKITTLQEIRASVFDFVTIGEFELQKDIEVIDLENIDKISPFLLIDFTQLAINKNHLRKIGIEISKPLRKSDSSIDYLPTQYICDFIKSKGYSGVRYKSTMGGDGYNIAIFDENLFRCEKVTVHKICGLGYSCNPIV